MFKALRSYREATQQIRRKTLVQENRNIQRKIEQLLGRIVDADLPLVAKALEKRGDELQRHKFMIEEKLNRLSIRSDPTARCIEPRYNFLKNPIKYRLMDGLKINVRC